MTKHLRNLFVLLVLSLTFSAYAQSDVTTVFNNDFSEFTNGSEETPGTTDIGGYSGALYTSTAFPKWNGSKVYEAGGKLLLADNGYIQTANYDMTANSGIVKISIKLRASDSYGGMVTISYGYSTSKQVILSDDKWTEYSVVMQVSQYGQSYIKVAASLSVNGVFIDDFKIEQSASFFPAPSVSQPTIASKTSFTATWRSVSGATNYLLDVYSKTDAGKDYLLEDESVTTTYKAVSGLDDSKTYYFTVRAQKGDAISEPSEEIRVVPVITEIAAPVATNATNVTKTGFTANWNAVDDANYYTVSLFKNTILNEDKEISLLSEDFSKVTVGSLQSIDFSLPTYGDLNKYTATPGWTQSNAVLAAGYIGIWSLTSGGYIQTPALDLSANNGAFKVSFDAAINAFGTFYAGEFKVQLIDSDDKTVLEEKTFNAAQSGFTTFTADFTKGKDNVYVRFYFNGSYKFFLDNVNIIQFLKAGSEFATLMEVVDTESTSHDFNVTFGENEYYTYSVTASAETVVSGEIDYISSTSSNIVKVANDPSGVSAVEDAQASVAANNGEIVVNTPVDATVEVYGITGSLLHKASVAAGSTSIGINANGIVLVRVLGKTYKVIL